MIGFYVRMARHRLPRIPGPRWRLRPLTYVLVVVGALIAISILLMRYAGLRWGPDALLVILVNDIFVVFLIVALDVMADQFKEGKLARPRHVARHSAIPVPEEE